MRLKNRSLLFLLILSFILLSIIPVSFIGLFAVNRAQSVLQDNARVFFQQLTSKNASQLDMQLSILLESTNSIKDNQLLLNSLAINQYINGIQKKDVEDYISSFMNSYRSSGNDIYTITFLKPNGSVLQFGEDPYILELLQSSSYSYEEIYAMTKGKTLDTIWFSGISNGQFQYLARYLYDYVNSKNIGIIILSMNTRVLDKTLKNPAESDNYAAENAVIADHLGTIVYSTHENQIGQSIQDVLGISFSDIPENDILIKGGHIFSSQDLLNGWVYIPYISYDNLISGVNRMSIFIIMVTLIVILLSILISFVISHSISKPIKQLLLLMKKVENGDVAVNANLSGSMEIIGLSNGFNSMIANMCDLIGCNEASYEELETAYSDLSAANDKLRILANQDILTGLPNRRAYFEYLDHLLNNIESGNTVAVFYMNIDDFKNINDSEGHSFGDLLLIDISCRLQDIFQHETHYLVRLGGDEFILVINGIENMDEIDQIASQIIDDFQRPYIVKDKMFYVSCSIGISLAPKDADSANKLLTAADSAMYVAKNAGKNTYAFYDHSTHEQQRDELKLIEELRDAIDNKDFTLFYQPQVDLVTNKICGFEGLLRWKHPQRGIIMPGAFIEVAERSGLIVHLTEWILSQACKQAKVWADLGFTDCAISINLSAHQFQNRKIISYVEKALKETKIPPEMLNLELTETIALDNLDYTIETMQQIKRFGIKFALDDFGTGYSSMNYLKRLPFDYLKIDKSFVDNIQSSQESREIMRAIVSMAHALKMEVVIEGVEYKEQEDIIRTLRSNIAQGYLYSRPILPEDITALLLSMQEGAK